MLRTLEGFHSMIFKRNDVIIYSFSSPMVPGPNFFSLFENMTIALKSSVSLPRRYSDPRFL